MKDSSIGKTAAGTHNSNDPDFLPEFKDVFSGKYFGDVPTASLSPGLTPAEQPAGNRAQEDGVLHNRYGSGAGAGTRVSVNSKGKHITFEISS